MWRTYVLLYKKGGIVMQKCMPQPHHIITSSEASLVQWSNEKLNFFLKVFVRRSHCSCSPSFLFILFNSAHLVPLLWFCFAFLCFVSMLWLLFFGYGSTFVLSLGIISPNHIFLLSFFRLCFIPSVYLHFVVHFFWWLLNH